MRRAISIFALALAGATAATAATPVTPTAPAAKVVANSVSHPAERVTVTVPKTAAYVGSERFDLYGVADAEVHVFVEADAKGG